jgi:hypothetical protein
MRIPTGNARRRVPRSVCLAVLAVAGCLALMLVAGAHPAAQQAATAAAAAAPGTPAASQNASELIRKVREHLRLDTELQTQYTYLEKRRDVKLSKLGKVMVGSVRTFEVYPGDRPGRTYKRLIEVDGQRLAAAELDRRDEEHRQAVLANFEREKNESADDKAKRLKKEADEQREQKQIIDDGFAVYDITLVGQEARDGCQMTIAALTPRPNAQTRTDLGGYFKKFKGRAWVCLDDYQVARIEMEAVDAVTIGWGLLGRVNEGSKFTFTRKKVNGEIWLPAEAKFEATGRTLLFRKFELFTVTSYSDYKKFNVDTSTTYGDHPKEDP